MATATKARKGPAPRVHVYRGAPAVRSWSKYQATVRNRTLCGIPIKTRRNRAEADTIATEDPKTANCSYCVTLVN